MQALVRLAAVTPSSIKYKLGGLRAPYIRLLQLGAKQVRITTMAGCFSWEIDELTSQAFILGSYEPYMQDALLRMARPGQVVYDVGAHSGFLSLYSSLAVGPMGRVVAFEPNPSNCESIERQLRLNPAMKVDLLRCALGDCKRDSLFDASRGSSMGHLSDTGDLRVSVETIDHLVATGLIPGPNVIKIDVEGHEANVIRGATRTIRDHKPVILCDYDNSSTFGDLISLLGPLSYDLKPGPPIVATPSDPS